MKVHKIVLTVIDFDERGQEGVIETLEKCRVYPKVMSIQTVDVGEWTDDHPLNKLKTADAELARLFPKIDGA